MKRSLGTLTVGLLLSLVAITIVGGVAFGAIVGSRIQAEGMSRSSGISVQDSTDDEGQHIRWANTGTTTTRASRSSINPTATVNQVVVRGRQPSTGTAVMALYSDGAKVGTFTPPKGSTMGTVTVTLTSPIAAGTTPTFAIGPNANLANFVIVDWFELHNTGSTGGDTTPPSAPTIGTEPAAGSTDTDGNVSFTWTGAEGGGTFECSNVISGQVDNFSACPSPTITYNGLPNGSYIFKVRQIDAAKNVGAAASRNYSVSTPTGGDTTPPETTITSADLGTTDDNTPTFTFTGTDQAGVTGFECRVYASGSPAPAFSSCASPYTTATLSDGNYVFEVRAKDAAGNVDATPASDSFTVSGDAPSPAKPNFVFILTDDMRYDDLKYMPKTSSLLGKQGMTFTSAFVPTALCCPSRATIMRGQYTHNTGIWRNPDSPSGGWEGYKSRGYENNNIATHLNDPNGAGYRTGLFGKYFNTYNGTTKPPGWDDWFGFIGQGEFFNYDVNDNGTMRHFGTTEGAYSTDVLSAQTQEFIDASVGAGKPFFAYVAPKAPHGPLVAAPRHETLYDGEQAPRPPTSPAFNEGDVSDKPPWIRSLPRLTTTQIASIDTNHEGRVETLQAVDDLVKAVVDKLQSRGALGNTYVVFTSDNGYHLGEHRIPSEKLRPYEESIHVPLLVSGPGVRAASTTDKLVLNTDFLPTFTDLAGTTTPTYVDGRSLRPVLTESATSWRTAILLESRISRSPAPDNFHVPYDGIRTTTSKYVEYEGGSRELYTLSTDPYEESSTPTSSSAPNLQTRLQALKGCARDSCRAAENGP